MKTLCIFLFTLPLSCLANTAVDDVSVNYLTSLHYSGPEGWPTAGKPYAPPIYNAERDQLLGISSTGHVDIFGNDTRAANMWGLAPVQGHYFSLAKDIKSYVGFAEHPQLDRLYSIDLDGNIFYVHSDGSNKNIVFDNSKEELSSQPNVQPIFDQQGRLLFIDTDGESYSRLMRLDADNTLIELHRFNNNPHGYYTGAGGMLLSGNTLFGYLAYPRGTPFLDTLSIDDDFIVGALYAMDLSNDPVQSPEIIHEFTLAEGEVPWTRGEAARIATYLVEDQQGYLYGTTSVGTCKTKGIIVHNQQEEKFDNGICGGSYALYSVTDKENLIHTEYPHYDGSNPFGSVFRVKKDGSDFVLVHTFSDLDGSQPRGPMAITDSGYLYGTTMGGGVHKDEVISVKQGNPYPSQFGEVTGNGTIYRIRLADIKVENGVVVESGFEHVHSFKAGIDVDADGKVPTGIMLAANGNLYGTTLYGGRGYTDNSGNKYLNDKFGTVFEVDLSAQQPTGSVSISITPGSIKQGEQAEVTWSSFNATDCKATGETVIGDWQPDSPLEPQGSMVISPQTGVYTLTVNCKDSDVNSRFAALATLYVDAEAKAKDSESLSYGNGGSLDWRWLFLFTAAALFKPVRTTRFK